MQVGPERAFMTSQVLLIKKRGWLMQGFRSCARISCRAVENPLITVLAAISWIFLGLLHTMISGELMQLWLFSGSALKAASMLVWKGFWELLRWGACWGIHCPQKYFWPQEVFSMWTHALTGQTVKEVFDRRVIEIPSIIPDKNEMLWTITRTREGCPESTGGNKNAEVTPTCFPT